MKHTQFKTPRSLTFIALAGAAMLAMGCADGVKLSAQQEQIHK